MDIRLLEQESCILWIIIDIYISQQHCLMLRFSSILWVKPMLCLERWHDRVDGQCRGVGLGPVTVSARHWHTGHPCWYFVTGPGDARHDTEQTRMMGWWSRDGSCHPTPGDRLGTKYHLPQHTSSCGWWLLCSFTIPKFQLIKGKIKIRIWHSFQDLIAFFLTYVSM